MKNDIWEKKYADLLQDNIRLKANLQKLSDEILGLITHAKQHITDDDKAAAATFKKTHNSEDELNQIKD